MGRFLSWTNYPVYKIPADIINFKNPSQEFSCRSEYNRDNLLFNIEEDYRQERPVSDEQLEQKICGAVKSMYAGARCAGRTV